MDTGDRLAGQTRWLSLLLSHLAGPRVRAQVDIEDLVQEVFLRAIAIPDGLPSHEPEELGLRRLLQRIARHSVIDVVRAMRARKRDAVVLRLSRSDWSRAGPPASELAASGIGPATHAGLAEQERALMRAFASLSSEHRRVLGLRQFEGLNAADAAQRMGRSKTAVHSLYRRALQAWARAQLGSP